MTTTKHLTHSCHLNVESASERDLLFLLYSMRSKNPLFGGIISSAIIACAHFVFSIVVVVTYIFVVDTFAAQIPQIYLRYGAAIALGILAYYVRKRAANE